jgi:hypothetical protein
LQATPFYDTLGYNKNLPKILTTDKMEVTMETIKEILVRRDNLTSDEADALISETKEELASLAHNEGGYEDAVDIIAGNLGLEPDYMDELLFDIM